MTSVARRVVHRHLVCCCVNFVEYPVTLPYLALFNRQSLSYFFAI